MLKKNKILKLNQSGDGVFLDDDREISVPYVMPDEVVQVSFVEFKKKKVPILEGVIEPHPERIKPVCPHFTICGGCQFQHFGPVFYRAYKKNLAEIPLKKVDLDTEVVKNPIIIPAGRRRRVNLEAIKKGEETIVGFHRRNSHQIVNLLECHTVVSEISSLLTPLRNVLSKVLEPYQKAKIFLTQTQTGIDFWLEIQKVTNLSAEKRVFLKEFAQENRLCRLIFRYRKTVDVIHQEAMPVVSFDGVDVEVDAFGFLQASDDADRILTELVLQEIPSSSKRIADLFCGRGTFTLPLSSRAPVDAVEFDKRSSHALQRAVERNGRPINVILRNLFENPLTVEELSSYDVVVIDPPRAGADAQVKQLGQSPVGTIIYISCGPESFARDAKILQESGFVLIKVTPVDQFPWANHVELVGVFKRQKY